MNLKNINKKIGQLSIPVAIVLAGGTGAVGGLSSYYGSQISTREAIAEVKQDVAVLQSEKTNIKESVDDLTEEMKEMRKGVNALLIQQGINPNNLK